MKELSAALGNRIRALRKAKGMSQEELGFKASLSAAHVGQIERGLKKPTVETLGKIASALDLSLQELFAFDVPAASAKISTPLDRITAYVSVLTEEEQKDLYKVIRLFKRFRDREE